ncbi:hypothetical protein ACSCB1_00645 [Streptomyces europaeiscabiei]|uniref:hypothetical protein n=1 Tax=Streptomyces europaeiscabiei TaxID=146819 RepID=UPI00069A19E8
MCLVAGGHGQPAREPVGPVAAALSSLVKGVGLRVSHGEGRDLVVQPSAAEAEQVLVKPVEQSVASRERMFTPGSMP